ncbi:prolyl oligopeptidase family serine peptidase [Candidatus Fermentibacterales bacterium]|nr:prolyl oligopeptidase family serine peptidase [Candidatus Fermentibacterales bacterium]
MTARRRRSRLLAAAALALPALAPCRAFPGDQAYMTPSDILVDIVDAPRTPVPFVGPDNRWALLLTPQSNPSIAELEREELRLAGLRFNPSTNAPSRDWLYLSPVLLEIQSGQQHEISGLPDTVRILAGSVEWSPDGAMLCFTNTTSRGNQLWIVDLESGRASKLLDASVSLVAEEYPCWLPGSDGLVCCIVPADRGPSPRPPAVPSGPVTRETFGAEAPARTYADLLESAFDEDLFEHHMTTTLARVDLQGRITELRHSGMTWSFDPSPDGRYLLLTTICRPFSYAVTVWRFAMLTEVVSLETGRQVHLVADLPVQDQIPIAHGSTSTGPRSVHWRSDEPAALCWVEALDGGDAGAEADWRDRVFLLPAPFDGARPDTLVTLQYRLGGLYWGGGDLAIVAEWWWPNRAEREWRLFPDSGGEPLLLLERSWEDSYSDPGRPLTTVNAAGKSVLITDPRGRIYRAGAGASPEGNMPFLDVMDVSDGSTARLLRSTPPFYEQPLRVIPGTPVRVLVRREAVEEPPNYYVRDLSTGAIDTLTRFPHPTPQLTGYTKQLLVYERTDGLPLSATLFLPSGYEPGTDPPLPMVFWAYPEEYQSRDAAGQVTTSPYRFDRIGWWSPLLWLLEGYGILYGPSMPIVAEQEGGQPNDSFVTQLVMSAEAAVNEVVSLGVADPDRLVIGGHSYGAFMTANLLAHSDLFAAGIAQTGAYNRTLTPFGFQSEDRSLWDAPGVYFEMSPFMHADMMDEPVLLIHGEADNNPGTLPMQSERLFEALRGLGGTARLVMLPLESHSYTARESILHLLWEIESWLERRVGPGWSPGS